eukprot:3185557-Alexandrium_andersonii.AAC.1
MVSGCPVCLVWRVQQLIENKNPALMMRGNGCQGKNALTRVKAPKAVPKAYNSLKTFAKARSA